MSQQIRFTRRRFLQTAAVTSAWALSASSYSRVFGANGRLNVAFIGTSGIAGSQSIGPIKKLGAECPCYCDADEARFGPAAKAYPQAKGFTDYRKMYDAHMKDIDAVMVATPDHHHYPATIIAMMNGKHCYTQKPLTHTMWEARQLGIAVEKYKLATQMGNQMHANEGNRRIVEWIRSGKLGTIKEAHIWTNRPVWPQGNPTPTPAPDKKPAGLNWDAWLGPAPEREYVEDYAPFKWRGALAYGTGAIGDMGCHTTDGFYWGMEPGFPVACELVEGEPVAGKEQYGKSAALKFEFAAKGDRPAFNYYWYEGGKKPKKPDWVDKGLEKDGGLKPSGGIIIGENGAIQYLDDYGNNIVVYSFTGQEIPEPEQTLERSEGHHQEWYSACLGEKPYDHPKSNFKYAAMLTESVLLGTIAEKVGGRVEYDSVNQKITNNDAANEHITKKYREGWEFKMS